MQAQVRDGVACTVAGDTIVTLWTTTVTPQTWRWQLSLIEQQIAAHAQGVIVVNVITGPHSMPEPAVNAEMRADYQRIANKVRRVVIAPVGDSLWTSVVRAVVRSMALIIGQSKRLHLVDTVVEALGSARAVASAATPSLTSLAQIANEQHLALGLLAPSHAAARTT